MAAARASLLEVLTPDAYEHLNMLNDHMLKGCDADPEEVRPAGLHRRDQLQGLRHLLARRRSPTTRPFKANQDGELTDLAWLYTMNRGIFMTPGREEEWTLSVTHSIEDCDQFVAAFEEMAHDLTS